MRALDIHSRRNRTVAVIIPAVTILCVIWICFRAGMTCAQDVFGSNYSDKFDPSKPTLVLKYEVAYRLFWLNLMHLADATVYATDGEWFNESTGEWLSSYLLIFCLDTFEDPSDFGKGRYSIHNRLATILLKPSLEPLFFAKRDFMHVDTFYDEVDVHNTEYFSVEAGKFDYVKNDLINNSVATNMPYFSKLASQRSEVFRFMKTISAIYAGDKSGLLLTNDFSISIYTDNAFVPFIVRIAPRLKTVDVLDREYQGLYFEAKPAPGFSGKGRNLAVWVAPFRYIAGVTDDPDLIWLSHQTFEMGMLPLISEFGLKFGAVRCSLTHVGLRPDFEKEP